MTDHLVEARLHLDRAETGLVPGQRVDLVQTYLLKAQMHLLRAQLDAFDPQPDQRAELAKVNAVLHEHGFAGPLGAAGVDSALSLQTARWEAAKARIGAALKLCDEWTERHGNLPATGAAGMMRLALTEDAT